ncbi:heme-binding protein [Bradyrhizobium sp.]|uniref:GlcG/HbpS family heme-binding protein n=1 Tax=Bradyrhizobium sp. TaxID=376 RepID=UPI0034246FD3
MRSASITAVVLALGTSAAIADESATVTYKSLSPEVALQAAQAALKQCRTDGFQIAVAVVDRFGQPQVMLRDRYAGLPAADAATRKAYTALGFHAATSDLAKSIKSGKMDSGLGLLPHVAMLGVGW